jgi:orotate phosphoribosyltransferase
MITQNNTTMEDTIKPEELTKEIEAIRLLREQQTELLKKCFVLNDRYFEELNSFEYSKAKSTIKEQLAMFTKISRLSDFIFEMHRGI